MLIKKYLAIINCETSSKDETEVPVYVKEDEQVENIILERLMEEEELVEIKECENMEI